MANDMFSRDEMERFIEKELVAERARWLEKQANAEAKRILAKAGLNEERGKICFVQDYDNNRNAISPNWSNVNQGNWHFSQTAPQHDQPTSSWEPQGIPNQNRELSDLKELVTQMAQAQINSTTSINAHIGSITETMNQLAQLATHQAKTNETVTAQLKELAQFATHQSKINEAVTSDLKEVKSQLGQVIALVNEREHGKFPSDTVNPGHGLVKATSLRAGEKLQENVEDGKVPEHSTSARTGVHERSYDKESDIEAKTSARNVSDERSYEDNRQGLDAEAKTCAHIDTKKL